MSVGLSVHMNASAFPVQRPTHRLHLRLGQLRQRKCFALIDAHAKPPCLVDMPLGRSPP